MTTNIVEVYDGRLLVSYYKNYSGYVWSATSNICIPTNNRTGPKWEAVKDVFPDLVKDKTFVDIGASQGFFCFKALECGAKQVVGIEAHQPYWESVNNAIAQLILPPDNLDWLFGRWPAVSELGDVVMAMSVIHHWFPKRSLESILADLCDSAREYVIFEWVGREDRQVLKKGWLDRHPEYNRDEFLIQAAEIFSFVQFIHEGHHPSRSVYLLTV